MVPVMAGTSKRRSPGACIFESGGTGCWTHDIALPPVPTFLFVCHHQHPLPAVAGCPTRCFACSPVYHSYGTSYGREFRRFEMGFFATKICSFFSLSCRCCAASINVKIQMQMHNHIPDAVPCLSLSPLTNGSVISVLVFVSSLSLLTLC